MTSLAVDYKQTPKVSDDMCHTLTHEGDGGTHSAVAFAQNQHHKVRLVGGDGSIAGALSAQPGAVQQTYVAEPVAVRTAQTGANGCGVSDGLAHTVDTTGPEAVMYRERVMRPVATDDVCVQPIAMSGGASRAEITEQMAPTLTARNCKDGPYVAYLPQTDGTSSPASAQRTGRLPQPLRNGREQAVHRQPERHVRTAHSREGRRDLIAFKYSAGGASRSMPAYDDGSTPTLVTEKPPAIVLKVRGGSDTYVKQDGRVGTAGKGALMSEDVTFTVAATQDQTLFEPVAVDFRHGQLREEEATGTLQAKPTGGYSLNYQDGVTDGYVVRRLTPRECERLQGMPDDHTRIPWKGRPAEECPDGPRYKAIGNSMAVPVMRWIGERIQQVDEILGQLQ